MTFESALSMFAVMLLYVAKPGPTIIALIARSISDGFHTGVMLALGNTTAHVIYFLLAVYGYALVEAHLSFAAFLLKSAGAAYLIYIGMKGLLHLERGLWGGKPDVQTQITPFENYLSGLVICLSSPYSILFYIAIIPQFLPFGSLSPVDVIVSVILIVGTYLSMHLLISYMCSRARDTLKNEKIVRRINLVVNVIFLGLGVFFIASVFPIFDFKL